MTTAAQPDLSPRFVRRTRLAADEYHKNFHKLDAEVIAALTSAKADRVTPLMSKIYLRLVSAPSEFWEREGVLYFATGEKEGRPVKSSKVLYEVLGVASATAHKALQWMHGQGIVGYFAGKNGAGIRIFINRAAGSIGVRNNVAGKKILPFDRGSNEVARGSSAEPAFKDSYADLEVLDTDYDPRAPKNGAEQTEVVTAHTGPRPAPLLRRPVRDGDEEISPSSSPRFEVPVGEIVSRLSRELEPALQSAAKRAAAQEHERTREWLESRGLPKAARVAQREAFNVLRQHGVAVGAASTARGDVGLARPVQEGRRPLSEAEIEGLAQGCVAMLEVKGQAVEATLSEMSAEAGGFLPHDDAWRVRERAEALLSARRP